MRLSNITRRRVAGGRASYVSHTSITMLYNLKLEEYGLAEVSIFNSLIIPVASPHYFLQWKASLMAASDTET